MNTRSLTSLAKELAQVLVVAAVYYGAARLGLLLAFEKTNASPVWPPSGIAFAAVLLLGYRVWPGILLGAFLANAVVFLANQPAGPLTILVVSAVIGIGNTLEALAGGFLLRRAVDAPDLFERAQHVFKFTAVALVMGLVSASIGPTSLAFSGMAAWAIYPTVWFTWWLGDTVSVLVITPLLLAWIRHPRIRWDARRSGEALLLFLSLFVVGRMAFGAWLPATDTHYPLAFMTLPFLVWAAFRFGQREVTTALAIVSWIAVWDTVRGFGPFAQTTVNESLLLLQFFVGVATVTILAMAALATERRAAEAVLRKAHDELEARVNERTAEVVLVNEFLQLEIAERKRTEERFRALLQSAPEAQVIVNPQGEIVLVNRQAEELFGYAREELLGMPVETLVPARFRDRHAGHRAVYMTGPRTRPMGAGLDLYALRKDGREVPVEISLSPLTTAEGPVVIASVRDVTDRKQAEETLRTAHERLGKAHRELEAFTHTVAHDLKGPLRGMEGFARALVEDYAARLDATGRYYLTMMQTSARRMGELVDDLLRYSRLERREMKRERVALRPLLEGVCEKLQAEIRARGLTVRMDFAVEVVEAAPEALHSALANLVENAAKFNQGRGGAITIKSRKEGDAIILSVADTGIGFDMKYHDRIFQIFERLHREEDYPGTGVGLAIVRKVAERHGGRTWAVSELGKGSTFYLALPTNTGGTP
ncbi:MAG: MASE1 domain-containing protein [Candidatus Rokubacteria bacterium]|nr:MASE1 domain-containing protein [Candidatus Rokubacteria bacterium]